MNFSLKFMIYNNKEYNIVGEYNHSRKTKWDNKEVVIPCADWVATDKCKLRGYDLNPDGNECGNDGQRWIQATTPNLQLRPGDKVVVLRPIPE